MHLDVTTIAIIASLASVAAISLRREMRRQRQARAALQAAQAVGGDQPISLHPAIDPNRCVGCAGCVVACPEGDVLMIVDGRSRLVNAAHCVGHGACKSACPNNAIELVFGTSTRGVQLPELGPDYQTNVPGLYIAGELGGMGLIRNAIGQGVHAVANLERGLESTRDPGFLDVAIVGAGPAGIAAALACRQRGLSHVVLDQEGLGGSVIHYPRRKLVMSAPVDLPLVGKMHFREIGKEALLHFWTTVVRKANLQIRAPERVTDVRRVERGFEVRTDRDVIRARRVLLAIGRRGTPRKLGVPGEESEKVSYRLLEPERWANRRVLVVGGGNSAVEAATALADAGADTTLSYRGAHLHRVAPANAERLEMQRGRNLHVLLESHLVRIEPQRVVIETPTGAGNLDNDQVFVLIGGELPADFLDKIGVRMRWHHGERPAAGAVAGGRP